MKMSITDKLFWFFSLPVLTFVGLSYSCVALESLQSTGNEQEFADQSINIINDGKVCITDDANHCLDAWIMIGEINEAMTHALTQKLDTYGTSKPFCLMSGGGDIKEAAKMATMLERHHATTCLGKRYVVNNRAFESSAVDVNGNVVTGTLCMSACPMVLAGGTQRIAYGDTHVGVHSARSYIDFCICEVPTSFSHEQIPFDKIAHYFSELSDKGKTRILKLHQWGEKIDANDMRFLGSKEINNIGLFSDIKVAATNA